MRKMARTAASTLVLLTGITMMPIGLAHHNPFGNALCFCGISIIAAKQVVASRKGRRMIRVIINHLPQWPF